MAETLEIYFNALIMEDTATDDLKQSQIKTFNTIILRILENAPPQNIYTTLFKLLIKFRKQ